MNQEDQQYEEEYYGYDQRQDHNVIPPIDDDFERDPGENQGEDEDGMDIPIDKLPPYLQEIAINDPEGFQQIIAEMNDE